LLDNFVNGFIVDGDWYVLNWVYHGTGWESGLSLVNELFDCNPLDR